MFFRKKYICTGLITNPGCGRKCRHAKLHTHDTTCDWIQCGLVEGAYNPGLDGRKGLLVQCTYVRRTLL